MDAGTQDGKNAKKKPEMYKNVCKYLTHQRLTSVLQRSWRIPKLSGESCINLLTIFHIIL